MHGLCRYLYSGYIEFQPLGRTPARHFFLFFEPKFSFGRNIPQLSYTASMAPIAYERSIGIGFQLPRNFELRATQHQVDWLGRYSKSLGTATFTPMALTAFMLLLVCAVFRRLRSPGGPFELLVPQHNLDFCD